MQTDGQFINYSVPNMIICHSLRLAFQDVPKVGSTSLFKWFYELSFGSPYVPVKTPDGRDIWLHDWFTRQKSGPITSKPLNRFVKPEGYFVFCLTRDPVKRLLSAYTNRVFQHWELAPNHPDGKAAIEAGLEANPKLEYFVENLERYQAVAESIFHHTRPMVDFIGRDPSRYDRMFDLAEMPLLRERLMEHWRACELPVSRQDIPSIPREQTSGTKLGLDALSPHAFEKLLAYYAEDYELLPTCSLEKIRAEKYGSAGTD